MSLDAPTRRKCGADLVNRLLLSLDPDYARARAEIEDLTNPPPPRWVSNRGDGPLGYAQFPGGPGASDGVVILHTAFGDTGTASAPFDKGRSTTHEVGHWLNLFHIWGDDGTGCQGSDRCPDTPKQA